MARVYISYAHEDWDVAAALYERLAHYGHDVFLDQHPGDGVRIGDAWEARLYECLGWADAMVCVVTVAYLSSLWSSAEIGVFRYKRGRLLPLNVESAVAHPLLSSVQSIDYAADPRRALEVLHRALWDIDAHSGPCRRRPAKRLHLRLHDAAQWER